MSANTLAEKRVFKTRETSKGINLMDYAITLNRYQQTVSQKKLFLGILVVSLLINLLQGVERLTVTEKIIVLPPVINKEIWIKGNAVSEGYLEEWSLYLTNLLLNVSSKTISYQAELALRHVSPDFSGKMQLKFKKDAEILQKNNATTTFFPKEIVVVEKNMTATVTGTFATFVGKEKVSSHEQTYQLQFVFNKGRFLQLIHFKQTHQDGKKLQEESVDTGIDLTHSKEKQS